MITIGVNKKPSSQVAALDNEFNVTTGFSLVGNTLTFNPSWVGTINNVQYTNYEQVVLNVPYTAAADLERIDIAVFTTDGTFVRIAGGETNGSPAAPPVPQNTLLATFFKVTNGSISDPAELQLQGMMLEKLFSWVMQLSMDVAVLVDDLNTPQLKVDLMEPTSLFASSFVSGKSINGRNLVINNGVNIANFIVDSFDGFTCTIIKEGTGAITFIEWPTRTLNLMDGTAVLNGAPGSRATIVTFGTVSRLYITNY
ncbi:hypothetical protein FLJC2902T_17550 [Flavobacterium limnosediminis JC2902]|uniref:Uncharacterized protein n=1 Tax=Flavobacterium limnosediminis JC2902 TaxID=1341181 RepID=V6SQA6_9FLAO|nr:hypothetical protein [Flavobacterium limnosediminis]ESU28397.1 hypothetical protein FLJC2902T_17550 [Flavobacterium limnosediminis JC2902]